MSVLACSRRGCENIMCDDHIDFVGYICFDCLSELKGKYGNKVERNKIEEFMDTMKEDEIIDLTDL